MATLTCDACGGNSLTMTDDGQFSVCDFCGTKHSIERIRAKIQEIKGVVEITKGEAEKTRLLKNAETWLNLNDPKKAEEIYTQLTNDYPDDYRGWLGLLIYNCKYEKIARYSDVYGRNDGSTYNQICTYADHIVQLTKDQTVFDSVLASIREYFDRCSSQNPRYYFEMLSIGYDNLKAFAPAIKDVYDEIKKYELLQKRFDDLPIHVRTEIAESLYHYCSVRPPCADQYRCSFVSQDKVGFWYQVAYSSDGTVVLKLNAPFSTIIDQAVTKDRMARSVCLYCGGPFAGLFKSKCSLCGKPKNYK